MILDNQNGLLLMRNDHLGEREWRSDDCYKLIFSPVGKGTFQTKRFDLAIDTNEYAIVNPHEEHKQLHITEEKFLVEINQSLIREIATDLKLPVHEPEFALLSFKHPQISTWVDFVHQFMEINDSDSDKMKQLFLENALAQLTILMLRYGAGSHLDELPTVNANKEIQQVIHALKESYEVDWNLDDMATFSGLNKYQFSHLFKQTTGLSPYAWLQLYRLIKSQYLLAHTKSSILAIALQVGFKSVGSYNQLFKKVFGKTPTIFRKLYHHY